MKRFCSVILFVNSYWCLVLFDPRVLVYEALFRRVLQRPLGYGFCDGFFLRVVYDES